MQRYIQFNSEFGLAICVQCRTGIPKGYLMHHFHSHHKPTRKEHQKVLTEFLVLLSPCEETTDLKYPEEVREPMDRLEIRDGWACREAGCSVCGTSEEYVQKHCRHVHGVTAAQGKKEWYPCQIQTLLGHPHIQYPSLSVPSFLPHPSSSLITSAFHAHSY